MGKRQELRDKRRQQERTQRITMIVVLVIVAAFIVGWVIVSQRPIEGIVKITPVARPQAKFNAAGDPNAPVKMIEYADFQCPFCRNFWRDTEMQIMDTYVKTGKVYYEYHALAFVGTDSGNTESQRAAEAAYCAGDQDKFWEMHDTIFANQGANENSGALDDAHLKTFAQNIGLDMAKFNDCFGGGKYTTRVVQEITEAEKIVAAAPNHAELVAANKYSPSGLSTPSFMVNGRLIPGALSFGEFQKEIDAALAAAGK
jgi:protein-disulfide isomerase